MGAGGGHACAGHGGPGGTASGARSSRRDGRPGAFEGAQRRWGRGGQGPRARAPGHLLRGARGARLPWQEKGEMFPRLCGRRKNWVQALLRGERGGQGREGARTVGLGRRVPATAETRRPQALGRKQRSGRGKRAAAPERGGRRRAGVGTWVPKVLVLRADESQCRQSRRARNEVTLSGTPRAHRSRGRVVNPGPPLPVLQLCPETRGAPSRQKRARQVAAPRGGHIRVSRPLTQTLLGDPPRPGP